MTKANFIFLSMVFVLLALSPLLIQLSFTEQNTIAVVVILLLGIPHGAIDNLLFLERSAAKPLAFYAWYLGAILANILLWTFLPVFSILVFLAISAYHFGQAQFSKPYQYSRFIHPLLYFFWGLSVLLGFFIFNLSDLQLLFQGADDLKPFLSLIQRDPILLMFVGSNFMMLLILIYLVIRQRLTAEAAGVELIVIGLIYLSAYLFPFLIAFTLFFTIIHSTKVLQQEFNNFYSEVNFQTVKSFVFKLLPYTVLSLFGIAIMMGLIYLKWITVSYTLALLVAVSSITLPHVFVMEQFYKKSKSEN